MLGGAPYAWGADLIFALALAFPCVFLFPIRGSLLYVAAPAGPRSR